MNTLIVVHLMSSLFITCFPFTLISVQVLATILVKDFTHRETGERYLCGTHPIVEIDL